MLFSSKGLGLYKTAELYQLQTRLIPMCSDSIDYQVQIVFSNTSSCKRIEGKMVGKPINLTL